MMKILLLMFSFIFSFQILAQIDSLPMKAYYFLPAIENWLNINTHDDKNFDFTYEEDIYSVSFDVMTKNIFQITSFDTITGEDIFITFYTKENRVQKSSSKNEIYENFYFKNDTLQMKTFIMKILYGLIFIMINMVLLLISIIIIMGKQ